MLGFCTPITSALWPKYDHNVRISEVKHYLVGFSVVKPKERKLHFCVAYFLKTCIKAHPELRHFDFTGALVAFGRPDLQSFPPHNYHLLLLAMDQI